MLNLTNMEIKHIISLLEKEIQIRNGFSWASLVVQ